MNIKEGTGWKACYNEVKGVYGAEVCFQGSWELYEISAEVFDSLNKKMKDSDAEKLIRSGRRLYSHVNDRCSPPYTIVIDADYADYCPWMAKSEPVGKTFDKKLTDAAIKLFGAQEDDVKGS